MIIDNLKLKVKDLFIIEKKPQKGLLAAEWVVMGYLVFTLVVMALFWDGIENREAMLQGRFQYVMTTLAMWVVYRLVPCRLTLFARIVVQMAFLGWWYPDTYELNRQLPNLDHLFASAEQALFGCQPALVFSNHMPWGWFSELMCLGYVSYFPLIALTTIYYFFLRYKEFRLATFVILTSFFVYYVVFVLLPVTGPQFYYLAVGTERIAEGVFPNLGDWFLTHSERMAAPGWSDGFFYHLLDITHDAGERPTAAFPSSHVGVTTVLMMLALRTRCRWLVFTMLPFYILMCLSTVYIYAHYAIDVIAGLITGVTLYYLLIAVGKRWS
jgi:membrane-associated phospholipid phosphatase